MSAKYTHVKTIQLFNAKGEARRCSYSEGLDALGHYSQVKFVNLNAKTQGLIAATSDQVGSLAVYSTSNYEKIVEQVSAHLGQITQMALSPDNRHAFTAGDDGSIFIFDIGEQLVNIKDRSLRPYVHIEESANQDKKASTTGKDPRLKIVDSELAEIVLVRRDEMAQWQQRQNNLKYDLALTKKKVEMKLIECKKRFERQYAEIEKQKDLDIQDLHRRYNDLQK